MEVLFGGSSLNPRGLIENSRSVALVATTGKTFECGNAPRAGVPETLSANYEPPALPDTFIHTGLLLAAFSGACHVMPMPFRPPRKKKPDYAEMEANAAHD